MNRIIYIAILFLFSSVSFAQLVMEDGSGLYIEQGTSLYVTGDIMSDNATLWNQGTIDLKGNLANNTGNLFDNSSTGTFKFSGTTAQEITGDHDAGFYGITEIDNSNGLALTNTNIGADQTVNGELKFTNGKLALNEFNLLLGETEPSGFSADNFVQTNNSGELQRTVAADGVSMIVYPVGNSAYNPVILQNSHTGTTDVYGVRVEDQEPAGLETDHFVDRSWVITEQVPEGTDLTVIPQWIMGEELTGFNRNLCAVGRVSDVGPVYQWFEIGPASGSDPFTRSGESFTQTGTFTVGDNTIIEEPDGFMLKDSENNLLAGGALKYYDAGWQTATETSDGVFTFDTEQTTVHLKMHYAGGAQQVNNVLVENGYTFYTQSITVELLESTGTGIAGGEVLYYASGWKDFGVTDGEGACSKELLPVVYHFKMKYLGASQQKSNINVGTTPTVTYQTSSVVVELLDSENVGLPDGEVLYYASGWKDFGITDGDGQCTKELLPVVYHFKMKYLGASQQKSNINVGTNPTVTYQTSNVTVELLDSDNVGLPDGEVLYYASGWKDFGTTDGDGECSKELLPVVYHFKMKYLGASQQKSNINVGTTPTVTYQTTSVVVELLDSENGGLPDGEVLYYASGWKDFGTTDGDGECSKELLPVVYHFKMKYLGASQQKSNINVGTTSTVTYQTTLVTVKLLDASDNGIEDGEAKYYASGWKDFGITDETGECTMELLPVVYHFKMYYEGDSDQISNWNTGADPIVIFYLEDLKVANADNISVPELQFYPNPFRYKTNISFVVPQTNRTILKLYNPRGSEVVKLFDRIAEANIEYKFDFDGTSLPQGIYVIHLQSGSDISIIKKLVINR